MADWPGSPVKEDARWPGAPVERANASSWWSGLGDTAADFLKSIPTGLMSGLSEFASLAKTATGAPDDYEGDPIGQAAGSAFTRGAETLPQPQGRGGEFGKTLGQFLGNPLSYVGPGGFLGKAATAATAALGSEAAGQATEGTAAEPYARIAGGMAGGVVPGMAARAITPFPTSPQRMAHVQNLRAEGIEPTAGDVTGRRSLKFAESALGDAPGAGGAYTAAREQIGQDYTRAALRRIGENATEATPQVIDRAYRRIGGTFDALAARNRADYDAQFVRDIIDSVNDYDHLFVDPMRKPMVDQVTQGILNKLPRGTMAGDEYKAMRSRVDRMRRGAITDPELSGFLTDVRDAMDELMERSIQLNNPRDLGAWRDVRNQYRNLLAIDKTVTGAGEQSASGIITPAKLRQAAVGLSRKSYARGQGDFADLARSGEVLLKPPPSSGTSERSFMHAIPGIGGAIAGGAMGGPVEGLGAAAAGLAAPGLAGRAIMSNTGQAYLKNQLIPGQPFRGGATRGGITAGANEVSPREQVRLNARAALRSADRKFSDSQTKMLREVARGSAPVDTILSVKRLLESNYGGPQ